MKDLQKEIDEFYKVIEKQREKIRNMKISMEERKRLIDMTAETITRYQEMMEERIKRETDLTLMRKYYEAVTESFDRIGKLMGELGRCSSRTEGYAHQTRGNMARTKDELEKAYVKIIRIKGDSVKTQMALLVAGKNLGTVTQEFNVELKESEEKGYI